MNKIILNPKASGNWFKKKIRSTLEITEKIEGKVRKYPENLYFFRRNYWTRNFGDELSPIIVREMLEKLVSGHPKRNGDGRLLAIGSILHCTKPGDIIWGSGVNGQISPGKHHFKDLDVRAVRGPLTKKFLVDRGIDCPEVYGDPGLLISQFYPKEKFIKPRKRDYIVIPNYNDYALFKALDHFTSFERKLISPLLSPWKVIEHIVNSDLVISSSLHGIIVAESYSIPSILILPVGHVESCFKYSDYYLGTQRETFPIAKSIQQALQMEPSILPANFSVDKLMNAFPDEIFTE